MLKTGTNVREARRRLQQAGGNVRQALESQRNKQPRATRKGK
jgi:N-acetylmuramic acid 6-phosphate (MurNAc-6-P) etherase